jgi:hypothetical protein
MKYEGSQSRITEILDDNKYFNNEAKKGWYVEFGNTDLETIGQMEFKNKEGKWFSSIKGTQVFNAVNLNSKEFSFQGIDIADDVEIISPLPPPGKIVPGCTDPDADNYNPNATQNDGSCTYPTVVLGCTNSAASNYDPNATVDDGSCILEPIVYGCTDPNALNYDPNATNDDGSCQLQLTYGCTDGTGANNPYTPSTGPATNYDPKADIDDGSCIYPAPVTKIYGCTDPKASNTTPGANIDDGSCYYLNSEGCDVNYKPMFLGHAEESASATNPSDKVSPLYELFEINIADKPSNYQPADSGRFNKKRPSGGEPRTANRFTASADMYELHWKVKIPGFNVDNDAYAWELRTQDNSGKWTDKTLFLGNNFENTKIGTNAVYPSFANFHQQIVNNGWGFVVRTDGGYANKGDKFSWLAHPFPTITETNDWTPTVEVEFIDSNARDPISNTLTYPTYKVQFPYSYDWKEFPTTGTYSSMLHGKYPYTFSNQHSCAIMYSTVEMDPLARNVTITPGIPNQSGGIVSVGTQGTVAQFNPNGFGYTNRYYANDDGGAQGGPLASTYDNSTNFLPYPSARFGAGKYVLTITHYKNFMGNDQTTCDYTQTFRIGYNDNQRSTVGAPDKPFEGTGSFIQGGYYNVVSKNYLKELGKREDILDFYNDTTATQVTPGSSSIPVSNTTPPASQIGPRPRIVTDDDASQEEPTRTSATDIDNNINNIDLNIQTDGSY